MLSVPHISHVEVSLQFHCRVSLQICRALALFCSFFFFLCAASLTGREVTKAQSIVLVSWVRRGDRFPYACRPACVSGAAWAVHNKCFLLVVVNGGGSCSGFCFLVFFFLITVNSYSALLNVFFLSFELQWYGICLSDVGDFEGIKTKIGNAYIIKEHFQVVHMKALMGPTDRLCESCDLFFCENSREYFCSNLLVMLLFWVIVTVRNAPKTKSTKDPLQ